MSKLVVGELAGLPENNYQISIDSNSTIVGAGSILQVKHVRTSPIRYSVATQDISAIPELSIDITPQSNTSKILVSAMISTTAQHVSTFGFLKNDNYIIDNTNTNSAGSIITVYDGADTNGEIEVVYIEYLDDPQTTSSINYKAAASASWSGSIRTLYINDRSSNDMRSISSMTVWEIAE